MARITIGFGVWLIAACAFPSPPSPDWRSGLLVFGAMMMGVGFGYIEARATPSKRGA